MALDLDTGKILWIQQDETKDVWHTGCPQGPEPPGFPPKTFRAGSASAPGSRRPPMPRHVITARNPKVPIGISPPALFCSICRTARACWSRARSPGWSGRTILIRNGALVWRSDISRGQIVFGGAADDEKAYFAMRGGIGTTAGLAAVQLSDGA